MDLKHRIFMYGTLKSGEPNHPRLFEMIDKGCISVIGAAETVHPYPLVVASRYNSPFLLDAKGQGKIIHGELYAVNDEGMEFTDQFEGHPDVFVRQEIDVTYMDSTGRTDVCTAWAYTLKHYKPELLEACLLENYNSTGKHGPVKPPTGFYAGDLNNEDLNRIILGNMREDVMCL